MPDISTLLKSPKNPKGWLSGPLYARIATELEGKIAANFGDAGTTFSGDPRAAERDPMLQLVIDDSRWVAHHLKDAAACEARATDGSGEVQQLNPDTPVLRSRANPDGWLLEELLPLLIDAKTAEIAGLREAAGGEAEREEEHFMALDRLRHANGFQARAAKHLASVPKDAPAP